MRYHGNHCLDLSNRTPDPSDGTLNFKSLQFKTGVSLLCPVSKAENKRKSRTKALNFLLHFYWISVANLIFQKYCCQHTVYIAKISVRKGLRDK